jgi:hypothetical protein
MIPYDKSIPFIEHFRSYLIPDTMAEAVEQFRLESVRSAMELLKVGPEIFELLATDDNSKADNFGSFCDPIGYFDDTSLNYIKPTTIATLPPLPSTLARLQIGGDATWSVDHIPEALRLADNILVCKIATLVAASFCDSDFIPEGRDTNLKYIALNNVDHPASEVLRETSLWQPFRRIIEVPDMVAMRKADFIQLFKEKGSPLEPREIECQSNQQLLDYATDLRAYILDRNRHMIFCSRCSKQLLYLNAQTMMLQMEHIC